MRTKRLVIRQNAGPTFPPYGNEVPVLATSMSDTHTAIHLGAEEMSAEEAAREARHSDVLAIAPDMPVALIEPRPVDADFESEPQQATSTWGIETVGAHRCRETGSGITVAVLDSGIDRQHPAFAGHHLVERDFTGDGDGDINGHGTHCAGTIFGRDVDGVRIGVARGIQRALIGKVLDNRGRGGTIQTLEAMSWAVQMGANVISMSLGIDFPGYRESLVDAGYPAEVATSLALEAYRANLTAYQTMASAIRGQQALGNRCIVIAASGNESQREHDADWVIAAGIPAASRDILSVGAVGKKHDQLRVAPFSNTGVNLVGPGVNIRSARARTVGLVAFNGTSMATPHVAGVACLWAEWLADRNQLTPTNLTSKLVASADSRHIEPGTLPGDIGLGCVQAPQS